MITWCYFTSRHVCGDHGPALVWVRTRMAAQAARCGWIWLTIGKISSCPGTTASPIVADRHRQEPRPQTSRPPAPLPSCQTTRGRGPEAQAQRRASESGRRHRPATTIAPNPGRGRQGGPEPGREPGVESAAPTPTRKGRREALAPEQLPRYQGSTGLTGPSRFKRELRVLTVELGNLAGVKCVLALFM